LVDHFSLLINPSNLQILARGYLPATASTQSLTGVYVTTDAQFRMYAFYNQAIYRTVPSHSTGYFLTVDVVVPLANVTGTDYLIDGNFDSNGNLWFFSNNGIVGYVVQGTFESTTPIVSVASFAPQSFNKFPSTDNNGGVFSISNANLYRFSAAKSHKEHIIDSLVLFTFTVQSTSLNRASGKLLGSKFVATNDKVDGQDNVVVLYRDVNLPAGASSRIVCTVPVFPVNESTINTSFIAYRNSYVVINNNNLQVTASSPTSPGLVRIRVAADGSGCTVVWSSTTEQTIAGVLKLSIGSNLIYDVVYADASQTAPPYQIALRAIDFKTGATVYNVSIGAGITASPLGSNEVILPNGLFCQTIYLGIVCFNDITLPPPTLVYNSTCQDED